MPAARVRERTLEERTTRVRGSVNRTFLLAEVKAGICKLIVQTCAANETSLRITMDSFCFSRMTIRELSSLTGDDALSVTSAASKLGRIDEN